MEIRHSRHQEGAVRRWKARIGEMRGSGLGIAEFCRRAGYDRRTMRKWMAVLEGNVQPEPLELVRLEAPPAVPPPCRATGLRLEAGGVVVRLERSFDDASLVRVLRAIAEASSC